MEECTRSCMSNLTIIGGGGVHDLRMDDGLQPGFQKAFFFFLPKFAVVPFLMMNFGGELPIFSIFADFSHTDPCLRKNLPRNIPLFREFLAKNSPLSAAHTHLNPNPYGLFSSYHLWGGGSFHPPL